VRQTLERYVHMLATSRGMDELASHFAPIAGGALVTEDGRLMATVPQFSLKKDWQNVQHYKTPPEVTRVVVTAGQVQGYGASAIRGTEYKVWIAKRDPQLGMPAPVAILVPEGHAFVHGPRVVGIGNL
jgi:hypothetical protein